MAKYVSDGQTTYEADVDNMVQAILGNGVLSGMALSAQASPNMTVQTASGVTTYGGVQNIVAAVGSIAVNAADPTNPRVDMIHVTSVGVVTYLAGTPSATPKPPALPATSTLLAYISVAAAGVNIQNSNITARIILVNRGVVGGLDANKPAFGNTGLLYFATDTNILYRDSGAAWVVAAKGALASVTASGLLASNDQKRMTPQLLGNITGAVTIDLSLGDTIRATLTGNVSITLTNPVADHDYIFEFIQDGTGSRTVTWTTTVKWTGGTTPVATTTINKKDIFTLHYDATDYLGVATLNF